MSDIREPYLVIAGPTAVGKTRVAIEVATKIDGEIVIADSRQLYRGLDIGTAKPSAEERAEVPHHLLDSVDIGVPYSAGDFARDARRAIGEVQARGRTAVVCGGTGFYLAALAGALDDVDDVGVGERAAARAAVEAIPPEGRFARLEAVDPDLAQRLHANDRQRIDRGLEVYFATGLRLSSLQRGEGGVLDHVAIRLTRSRAELHERIDRRLEAMIAAGLEDEARAFRDAGLTPQTAGLNTIGYREWWPFFAGRGTRENVRRRIAAATRAYAKRQETWFRNQGAYRDVGAGGKAAGRVLALWKECRELV